MLGKKAVRTVQRRRNETGSFACYRPHCIRDKYEAQKLTVSASAKLLLTFTQMESDKSPLITCGYTLRQIPVSLLESAFYGTVSTRLLIDAGSYIQFLATKSNT